VTKKKTSKKAKTIEKIGKKGKQEIKLTFRVEEKQYVLEAIEEHSKENNSEKSVIEIDPTKLRRLSIDSIHSPDKYRLLVARYQPDKPTRGLGNTNNWEQEYEIIFQREKVPTKGKKRFRAKEQIDTKEDDELLTHIPLTKEEIVEGRVYLLINDYKVDFTEEARKYAKWRYTRLLERE